MGVEWNADANLSLEKLLKSWRKAEAQYISQVEEAKKAGTPHDQMQGCAWQLHECAHNLERAMRTSTTELDQLKSQLAECQAKLKLSNEDWAHDDTRVKELARSFLPTSERKG